jgi:hypothetical protein
VRTHVVIAPWILWATLCCSPRRPETPPPESPATSSTREADPRERRIELRIDRPVVAHGHTIVLRALADSRCPRGVTCVWAGEAIARIDVQDEQGARHEITLTLGPNPGQERARVAHAELRLVDALPYPRAGVAVEPDVIRAVVVLSPGS